MREGRMTAILAAAAGGFFVGAGAVIGCIAIVASVIWKDLRGGSSHQQQEKTDVRNSHHLEIEAQ